MNREFEYKIKYEVDSRTGQVTATIPELNHISSYGDTFAEAEENVRDAALGYIEVLLRDHKDVPAPSSGTEGTYLKLFISNTT